MYLSKSNGVALVACALLVIGCDGFHLVHDQLDAGDIDADVADAAVSATPPSVEVTAPNGGETLYPAESFTVTWARTDTNGDAIAYDVAVVDENGSTKAIATGVSGTSVEWKPSGVAAPTPFKIRVTATSTGGMAMDESDAPFSLVPPSSGTSFARDVQPIFSGNCLTQFCHTPQTQTAQLNLAPGAAYASLVGVHSIESSCASYQRVRAGMPDESYLVFKLDGSGPCFYGVRMPKSAAALPAGSIATIRAWITEGALDN